MFAEAEAEPVEESRFAGVVGWPLPAVDVNADIATGGAEGGGVAYFADNQVRASYAAADGLGEVTPTTRAPATRSSTSNERKPACGTSA